MQSITPHIFTENCRQALAFYQQVFGGELQQLQEADGTEGFEGQEGKLLHAELHINDSCVLYLADVFGPDFTPGSQISLAVELDDEAEQDRVYAALAAEGEVTHELQHTFWGARFGSVKDRYGVEWELNLPQ